MHNSVDDGFCEALARNLPEDQMMILCSFVGDPDETNKTAWRPRPWRPGMKLDFDPRDNVYITTGSFTRAPDGTWRRRADYFAATHAFMIDDLGTKVPFDVLDGGEPSALIETSPGNFQGWFFFSEPQTDRWRVDQLIRAFIDQKLGGVDPGMASVTRVGRIPGATNGKRKYGGFTTRLSTFNDRRWTFDELVCGWDLKLPGTRKPLAKLIPADAVERMELFEDVLGFMRRHGMIQRQSPDMSGWIDCTCFNVANHTNKADTGAAIREPAAENGWNGSFRCHHGGCAGLGWKELRGWMLEMLEKNQ